MNIMQTLKKISVWRRLLLILILFGLSIESIYITNDLMMGNLSYQELVFTHLGDPTTFLSYVFFLLLAADFGFSRNGSKSAQYKTKRLGGSLGLAAAICGVFIALILVVSLLAMLLKSGSLNFSDEWSAEPLFGLEWVTPTLAALITVLQFFLRFLFMAFLIFVINSLCKKMPYGFIGGLVVCLIDGVVYINFNMIKPLRIFPVDYSYIESSLRLTPNAAFNVALCVLYWGVLIAAACLVYRLMHKGSRLEKEEGSVQI